jgi:hypothetical protein
MLRWAETNGPSFVRTLAEAAFLADLRYYDLLRPVLLKLKEEYPQGVTRDSTHDVG